MPLEVPAAVGDLSAAVVVGHIRTTAVDVLRGSGLDLAAALDMLEEAEAQDERHDRDRPTD